MKSIKPLRTLSMHDEKQKKLIDTTNSTLKKKDDEIRALKKQIIERGGIIPAFQETRLKDLPNDKVQSYILVGKNKILNRIAEIKLLGDYFATLSKSPEGNQIRKVQVMNHPTVQRVEVENHIEIQRVKIENPTKVMDVRVLNLREPKFPAIQNVKIINIRELNGGDKTSLWVPSVVKIAVESISELCIKLWKHGITVKLDDSERRKPIPVISVDIFGRPVQSPSAMVIPMGMGGRAVSQGAPTSITSGRKTVTTPGTAVQLVSLGSVCRKIIMTAPPANGGAVYVGGTNVSAVSGSQKGLLLLPTGSATIDIDDAGKIWIDSEIASEGITYSYLS